MKSRGRFFLFGIIFLYSVSYSLVSSIIQPYVLSLGVSMSLLGVLEALAGWRGIVTAFSQLFGGRLTDRYGGKKVMLLSRTIALLMWITYYLSYMARNILLIIFAYILNGLAIVSSPAINSLVAIISSERERGRYYSYSLLASIVPYVVFPPIGGMIYEKYGAPLLFAIIASIEVMNIVVSRILLEDLRKGSEENRIEIKAVLTKLKPIFTFSVPDAFFWAISGPLFVGFLSQDFGLTTEILGLFLSVNSAVWIIIQIPSGILIDRIGCKMALIAAEISGILSFITLIFFKNLQAILLSSALFGISPALWMPAINKYVSLKFGREIGSGLGSFYAVNSFFSVPGPIIGGYLFTIGGAALPFTVSLFGIALAALLVTKFA